MDLGGALIRGSNATVTVVEGDLSCVFKDRRKPDSETPPDILARRRKPPEGFAPLVGLGKIWVAQGYFTLRAEDVAGWGKSKDMHLMAGGMDFHITLLKPQGSNDGEKTWVFFALFLPTPDQLEHLPIIEYNEHLAGSKVYDPLVDYLTAMLDPNNIQDVFMLGDDSPIKSS